DDAVQHRAAGRRAVGDGPVDGAEGGGLIRVEAQGDVEGGRDQGGEVEDAADGDGGRGAALAEQAGRHVTAGGVAEDDRADTAAGADGVGGGADLTQDVAEADEGGEVVGGDGEADTMGQQRRGEAGEPAAVQRLPVAAVQEDRDGSCVSGGGQGPDFELPRAVRHLDGVTSRRRGGAVVVFGLEVESGVEGRGSGVGGRVAHRISLRIASPYPVASV